MVYKWEPWTQYGPGAVAEFEGILWKIVQPHRSQPDWTPPVTPALWSRVPEEECSGYHDGSRDHGVQEDHRNQPQQWQQPGSADPEKEQQGWLTDKRKHEMEIGGGILAMAGAGLGIYEYSKHRDAEQAKKEAWQQAGTADAWQQGAQVRTANVDKQNKGAYWVLVERSIPSNAIPCGRDSSGEMLYASRSHCEGALRIGKAGHHLSGGASFGYQGRELAGAQYEVLCGDQNAVRWERVHGRADAHAHNWNPVEGGRESDGRFIFVTHSQYGNGIHPGGATEGDDHACFGYGGSEQRVQEYEVLVYA